MSDAPDPDFVFDPIDHARHAERLRREQAEKDAADARRRARDEAVVRAITRKHT